MVAVLSFAATAAQAFRTEECSALAVLAVVLQLLHLARCLVLCPVAFLACMAAVPSFRAAIAHAARAWLLAGIALSGAQ